MKKTAFISVSFRTRRTLEVEIQVILDVLRELDYESLLFVDKYIFEKGHEREMMVQSKLDILTCDLLIAEVTDKSAIGVGIEIGYAAALQKPIIYLRSAMAEYSTTVGGTANYSVVYISSDDLRQKLMALVLQI